MHPNQPTEPYFTHVPPPIEHKHKHDKNPGMLFAIIALVSLVLLPVGLVSVIFGMIGLSKSRKGGHKNKLAVATIIIGLIEILAALVVGVLIFMTIASTCAEYGSGEHTLTNGLTIFCSY